MKGTNGAAGNVQSESEMIVNATEHERRANTPNRLIVEASFVNGPISGSRDLITQYEGVSPLYPQVFEWLTSRLAGHRFDPTMSQSSRRWRHVKRTSTSERDQ